MNQLLKIPKIALMLLFLISGRAFATEVVMPGFESSKVKYYNLSKIFDYALLEEFNVESEKLWSQLVRESGSEQAALNLMYTTKKPDTRLVQLHENLLQAILSSQMDNYLIWAFLDEEASFDYAHKTGRKVHPLLREITSNVRNYLTDGVGKILRSSRVRGYIFKRPAFDLENGIRSCTFDRCASMPEYLGKFTENDKMLYRAWVYAQIIASFDMADRSCARYLSAQGARQDSIYANQDFNDSDNQSPRSGRRGLFEVYFLTPFCEGRNKLSVPGTSKSRGQLYLSNTKFLD